MDELNGRFFNLDVGGSMICCMSELLASPVTGHTRTSLSELVCVFLLSVFNKPTRPVKD